MNNVFRVSGSYMAKYPDGHYSGKIGLGATIIAKNEREAKKLVARQTIETYGYVNFKWDKVSVLRHSA